MARIAALGATSRRRSRRDGLRALVIATVCGCVLLGLAGCTLVGIGSTTTVPVLNSVAPVPSGSGLYFLQFAQDTSGSHFTLVRVDAATGKPQWQHALAGQSPKIAVSDGTIYVVDGLDVLALRGHDGSIIWHTTLNDLVQQTPSDTGVVPAGGQPVVADGRVYIGIAQGLESPSTGRLWRCRRVTARGCGTAPLTASRRLEMAS